MSSVEGVAGVHWTVGRRIAALGVLFVIALAATAGIGFRQTGQSADAADTAFRVQDALANTIDAQHTASVVLAEAYRLSTSMDGAGRTDAITQLDQHATELGEHLAGLQASPLPEVRTSMVAFAPNIQAVLDVAKELDQLPGAPSAELLTKIQATWDAFDGASDSLKTQLEKESGSTDGAARASAHRSELVIALSAGLALPIVVLAMWLVTRAVAGPVQQTRLVLERVADGDFTQRMASRSNDDLGAMAAALNRTVERVGEVIGSIRQEADTLSTTSTHLSGVSAQVASGAQRVTAEATSVSGNAELVTSDIQSVAAGSEQMQASIAEIARNAADATQIVAEAVRIAEAANAIMSKLGTSSSEIEEVARVITSIADQTNLLALNATIEAARAGEAGKGFAVVASEVKELAQETGKATQGIGTRIEAIQSDSASAMAALQQISQTINRVQEIQQTIASAVEQQSASTQEISSSVQRIAGHTGDIATRIGSVTTASHEATAAAGQTRDAAGELAGTAGNLQAIVARFRVS